MKKAFRSERLFLMYAILEARVWMFGIKWRLQNRFSANSSVRALQFFCVEAAGYSHFFKFVLKSKGGISVGY